MSKEAASLDRCVSMPSVNVFLGHEESEFHLGFFTKRYKIKMKRRLL